MPVRELLERIDSRELGEWMAYCKIESDRTSGKDANEQDAVNEKIKAGFSPYQNKDFVEAVSKDKRKR